MDGGLGTRIDVALPPLPPRVRRRFPFFWVLPLAIAAGVGCWRYVIPIKVDVVEAIPGPFALTVSGPGLLDALSKAEVGARVEGRIAALPVEQGDVLRAGALIARLDAPDIVQQVTQTQADAEAARLQIGEEENAALNAKAAFSHAQADFTRKAALLRTSDATRADYDAARATLDQATADVARADASVQHARVAADSAAAAARAMEAQLADRTILAPVGGVITVRDHSVGDILTPGSPIVELVDPHSIIVSTRMDESAMGQIAPGQPAVLRFTSFPHRVFQGRVLRLGWSVDTTTREFIVDIMPAELSPHWAIGQRATVTITTGSIPNAIALPQSALVLRSRHPGVWIVGDDKRARWRAVRVGAVCGDLVEVKSGISRGDRVVVHPEGLYSWAPVHWRNTERLQP